MKEDNLTSVMRNQNTVIDEHSKITAKFYFFTPINFGIWENAF